MKSLCKNGRWYKDRHGQGVYAYKPLNGIARGGTNKGESLSATEAKESIEYCVSELAKDVRCSTEFIGVDDSDGQCWCVNAGDRCTEFVTDDGAHWQFLGRNGAAGRQCGRHRHTTTRKGSRSVARRAAS